MNTLSRFFESLEYAGLDVTTEEASEILWLAYQIFRRGTQGTVEDKREADPVPNDTPQVPPLPDGSAPSRKPPVDSTSEESHNIYANRQKPLGKNERTTGGKQIRLPSPAALTGSLVLGRALRPLRQRRPSRRRFKLNEQATVRRIAELQQRIWTPILEPVLVRRFELALIIDDGASMIFWQKIITEFSTLLERLGAFYDVRIWRLATEQREEVRLYPGRGSTITRQRAHNPKELIDPTGRRLFLVISDCVSPAWYSGKVQGVLEQWGQKNLVTLLQVLPMRLWPRTGLCLTERVELTASEQGIANRRLQKWQTSHWSPEEFFPPIPVVLLHEQSLSSWAKMVMGDKNQPVLGVHFARDCERISDSFSLLAPEKDLSPIERVEKFRAAASLTAYKLALLLSATPITLPIVRIIQQKLLRESTQVHVAEVFLGGLVQEIVPGMPHTRSEDIEYEFYPGVKEILFKVLSMPLERQILLEVSKYVIEHLGITRDFIAQIAIGNSPHKISIESGPLATIAKTVWKRAGGIYALIPDYIEEPVEEPIEVLMEAVLEETVPLPPLLDQLRADPDNPEIMRELIESLPQQSSVEQQHQTVHAAFEIAPAMSGDQERIRAWLANVARVPDEVKIEIIRELLKARKEITDPALRAEILNTLVDCLSAEWQDEEARIGFLDIVMEYLPEAWDLDAVQRSFFLFVRRLKDREQQRGILLRVLETSSEKVRPVVQQELVSLGLVENLPASSETSASAESKEFAIPVLDDVESRGESTLLSSIDTPKHLSGIGVKYICPSCFEEAFIGDCDIVSGRTGKTLKAAPTRLITRFPAHIIPEPLTSPEYSREQAQRKCVNCGYHLPYNIELVPGITIAVVGDTFSGKSHYIAALIHQLQTEWMKTATEFAHLTSLTPVVAKKFIDEYLEPLFAKKQQLVLTQSETKSNADPLIYNITIISSLRRAPISFNLMIYDAPGEDFGPQRLVNFARFALHTNAFIYVADPLTMPVLTQKLSPALQSQAQHIDVLLQRDRPVKRFNEMTEVFERYHDYPPGSILPKTPIAIMFSKSDLLKYANQPVIYNFLHNPTYSSELDLHDINRVDQEVRDVLAQYGQRDLLTATSHFKHVKFFATSATGEPPDQEGNFQNVVPCRCLDPFLWILYKLGIVRGSS